MPPVCRLAYLRNVQAVKIDAQTQKKLTKTDRWAFYCYVDTVSFKKFGLSG